MKLSAKHLKAVLITAAWDSNEDIDLKTRCIITHAAFYVGWPKGWAVFNMAKEVWAKNE